MREALLVSVMISLAAGFAAVAQGPTTDATPVIAAARQALGGEQKLGAIKTFVATGRTRQVRGNNLVPIEFQIHCELPDKYVRHDEVPAQETGISSAGFNGDALIQLPPPETPPAGARPATPPVAQAPQKPAAPAVSATGAAPAAAPGAAGGAPVAPPDPRKARVVSLKQDFVRLALGMFATSFPSYPLTFTLAGRAEAPQGTADIVDVKGAGTFAVKLFINSETHLPIMISWTMPATNVVMTAPGKPAPENLPPGSIVVQAPPPPAAGASKEEQDKYAKDVQDLRKKTLAGARPVEYRIYYADYRDVGGGVRFPFRLRRAIAGETVEETNFDEFKINSRIDPRKFQAVQ